MRQYTILLAILLVCSCPLLSAQQQKTFDLKKTFFDVELEAFVSFVATSLNKQVLYKSSVKGRKIFLHVSSPITKDELFQIFLSVMEYNNFIVEKKDSDKQFIIKTKPPKKQNKPAQNKAKQRSGDR